MTKNIPIFGFSHTMKNTRFIFFISEYFHINFYTEKWYFASKIVILIPQMLFFQPKMISLSPKTVLFELKSVFSWQNRSKMSCFWSKMYIFWWKSFWKLMFLDKNEKWFWRGLESWTLMIEHIIFDFSNFDFDPTK